MHDPSFLWHENGAFHYLWSLTTLIPILNKDNIIVKCFEIPLTCFFLVLYVNSLTYDMHIPHMYTHTHTYLALKLTILGGHPGGSSAGMTLKGRGGAYLFPPWLLFTHTQPPVRPALDFWEASLFPSQIPISFCQQLLHVLHIFKVFYKCISKKRAFGNPGSNLEKEWSYLLTSWF